MVLDGKPGAGVLSEEGGGRRVELAARRLSATQGLSRLFLVRHAWGSGLPASGIRRWRRRERLASWVASEGSVLKQCEDVDLSFLQHPEGSDLFSDTKRGTLFLTPYRVIFVTSHSVNDPMFSFMMPFDLMSNCVIEQPVFAPNYIKGTIQATPDGGWEGQAIFKLSFRKGGAIEFAELMMKASSAAARGIPFVSVNYWFSARGPYVVTGQGNMMCTQQMPCPGYPVVVCGPLSAGHGAPPAGYGAPPLGYGAQSVGYGALPVGYRAPPAAYEAPPAGYGAPPAGYGSPPAGYGAPPAAYGAPPAGYGAPPAGYRAPPAAYGAPPAGYGAPPVGYGVLPAEDEALPAGNEALPAGYGALPLGHETLPAENRAGTQKSVAAQPSRCETSLPLTSSFKSCLPSSE
ncbi:Postacrosomal sheath WW domain-binding protein [Manis javanica]|nr:Postacrosomal sheath WW domain-binding protein [Manis javanica]